MIRTSHVQAAAKWMATAMAVAAAAYGAYAGITFFRYGHASPPNPDEYDPLLDRFMPAYEIVERHQIRIAAPATVTLAAARDTDLQGSGLVRTIIKARELILGATPDVRPRPRGLLAETQSLGWGVLAEIPGREVVVGAVTRPWEADVTFRALPPDQFAAFSEPGYVKIVWTLRAEPITATESVFLTETRAIATDAGARTKFRRYWSFLSPGIIVIRWAVLGPVKREAERRAHLPAPVARYLRWALRSEKRIEEVRMRQAGTLRTDVCSERWMPFEAEHIVVPPATGFVWNARVRVAPLLHVRVRDALVEGRGSGQVSLLSAFTVAADAATPEMNSGSLHRYLAEAVWYPTALLPSATLRWTGIDATTALATLTDHDVSVSLEFQFADTSEVTGIYTPARWGKFPEGYRQVPWEGHFRAYQQHDGIFVPTEGDVGWYVGKEWQAVWKGSLTAFQARLES